MHSGQQNIVAHVMEVRDTALVGPEIAYRDRLVGRGIAARASIARHRRFPRRKSKRRIQRLLLGNAAQSRRSGKPGSHTMNRRCRATRVSRFASQFGHPPSHHPATAARCRRRPAGRERAIEVAVAPRLMNAGIAAAGCWPSASMVSACVKPSACAARKPSRMAAPLPLGYEVGSRTRRPGSAPARRSSSVPGSVCAAVDYHPNRIPLSARLLNRLE